MGCLGFRVVSGLGCAVSYDESFVLLDAVLGILNRFMIIAAIHTRSAGTDLNVNSCARTVGSIIRWQDWLCGH